MGWDGAEFWFSFIKVLKMGWKAMLVWVEDGDAILRQWQSMVSIESGREVDSLLLNLVGGGVGLVLPSYCNILFCFYHFLSL